MKGLYKQAIRDELFIFIFIHFSGCSVACNRMRVSSRDGTKEQQTYVQQFAAMSPDELSGLLSRYGVQKAWIAPMPQCL